MKNSSTKLINFLIGKSILDTVLMGVLVVGYYIKVFPPYFHGWGEATEHSISGWVVNNALPWDRVQVQLFIDGNFIGIETAGVARPDVLAAGWSKDQWHGYSFDLPQMSGGPHEARVYALHESGGGTRFTLQLIGDPIRFVVSADGNLVDVSKKEALRP